MENNLFRILLLFLVCSCHVDAARADDGTPDTDAQEPQQVVGPAAADATHAEPSVDDPQPVAAVELPSQKGLPEPIASAKALSLAFRQSAQKALPAVVTILTRTVAEDDPQARIRSAIGGEDDQKYDSVGSGVIVSADGLILTNHHVIVDADVIDVRLPDGRQFRADDSKSDPKSDVAIVRIPGAGLPTAEIGDSNDLYVGDWVLAIGSPFTLESSVSAGIISGTKRYRSLSQIVSGQFLQTDAAINPGNSGGPLIDLDGRVVGINTAISSRSGGFQGIGFAIPIARANWIKEELLNFDKVRRGYAGVRTKDVPYWVTQELDLQRRTGAYVVSVTDGYPAAKAGLRPDDIIVELASEPVESATGFAEIVQQSPIGEPLAMIVLRGGQRQELTIELEERP